jgi:catechol 2,3-dioxygenase-like lactoylglutathione lyase family enzyme
MIHGVHLLLYSQDPEADRAFFRDVLDFKSIDAGEGWLIFALPPAELGIHPGDGKFIQHHADQKLLGSVVYLMCDDLRETIHSLTAKGVATTEIQEAGWGITTTVRLPSGGGLGLYEPRHPTAIHLAAR